MSTPDTSQHVGVPGPPGDHHVEILTPEALDFVARLDAAFARRRREILTARGHRSDSLASGRQLDFPRATSAVRDDPHWRVAPPAPGLTGRQREFTGPPNAGAAAHALASGADVWIADFTEVPSPLRENILAGQRTLLDVCRRRTAPTLVVRPRGWHLEEERFRGDGPPVSATLVDFGLYFFHCARLLTSAGSVPCFHLSGLENRFEARLWNDVFLLAQDLLGIPRGTVRATVVIDTVTAAFEMEEILYELREHSSGLATDPWHYLFSVIGAFGHRTPFLLPDGSDTSLTAPCMRSYAALIVRTCERRNARATGDLTEITPVTDDAPVRAADLLAVRPPGPAQAPSRQQLRSAVALALRHTETWLRGRGTAVPGRRLTETATAELTRARLWQWRRQRLVSPSDLHALIDVASAAMARQHPGALVAAARGVLERTLLEDELPPLLTPDTYRRSLICPTGGSA
ncbi:malate synthase A [Streptomyces sp. NPDC085460]|uniref:malate synthase A n=1 Tax=Streptomyces sp. NPDC085460 TaxID=3365723 RepID=UPI0037D51D9D